MQLQENVLRQFLGQCPVVDDAPGEAEDHRLIAPHQIGERHGVSTSRPRQPLVVGRSCRSGLQRRSHALGHCQFQQHRLLLEIYVGGVREGAAGLAG